MRTGFVLAGWLALAHAAGASNGIQVRVVSGRPAMVSGGSALVEIAGASGGPVKVTMPGRDVSAAFRPAADGKLLGLVDGLRPGKNTIEVRAAGKRTRLELTNHPITGPVFSGPHQSPFVCQEKAPELGTALDADCTLKTQASYFYKSTDPMAPAERNKLARAGRSPGFKPLDPAAPRPSDLATTVTSEGKTVNYIVRRETGTINRAIYSIAFLHDPADPPPDPWTRSRGWNGRLVYLFGGGCRAGYRQGMPIVALDDAMLSKGYAHAASSLNVFGNNCDDVISAETLMMVKEHFIKSFGVPVHTIGSGGSGGSMQQHLISQNYPGLLDGITPSVSYPDITTMVSPVADCTLLAKAFEGAAQPWTDAQKTAVSGFATWQTCGSWMKSRFSPGWIEAGYCEASMPREKIYHPVNNPRGVRCTLQDNQANVYGRDRETGAAPGFVDNTGVQYGLAAFNAGRISAEQFVELNERMGGFDRDGNVVPRRTAADPRALRIAYRTGRVNAGRGGLATIPIIDYRIYTDTRADIHDRVRSFEMRARLVRANGQADNQVILTYPANLKIGQLGTIQADAVQLMDRWLDAIARDAAGAAAGKAARNKPPDLVDACWTPEGEKIAEPAVYQGPGRCNELYPVHADPRLAAGAPLDKDILKCALKPVDAGDYKQPLTDRQMARLKAAFPQGVCDYRRPGIEQTASPKPWLVY